MKCEYCNGTISLEDEVCPYCGMANEQAQQHLRDMKDFSRDYDETKTAVMDQTQRTAGKSVRIATIAVLALLVVAMFVLAGNAYSAKRNAMEKKAERNAPAYMAIMDDYLEAGDFLNFYSFCDAKEIDYFDSAFESYAPAISCARSYARFYDEVGFFIMSVSDDDYADRATSADVRLADALNYFYSCADLEAYGYYEDYDRAANVDAIKEMRDNVEQMLVTFCGVSPENAARMPELSQAKRSIILEEAYERLGGGDE